MMKQFMGSVADERGGMGIHIVKNVMTWSVVFLVLFVGPIPAQAITIEVNFALSNFNSPNPPTDPVIGTIIYEAVSTTANIGSLTSIDLTIAGHVYTIGEVGFASPFQSGSQLIGGLVNGLITIQNGTDDFWLLWNQSTLVPTLFGYTTARNTYYSWMTSSFSSFSVAEASTVPEPTALVLFFFGLVGMAGVIRFKY